MTLWIILVTSIVTSAIGLATAAANEKLVRELALLSRVRYSKGLMLLLAGLTLANVALWTRYAFEVDDWRFAAIAIIPVVLNRIGRIAVRATNRDPAKVATR